MASRVTGRTPLVLCLDALILYALAFYFLPQVFPDTRAWDGLPQLYFLLMAVYLMTRAKINFRQLGFQRKNLGEDLLIGLAVALVPMIIVARVWWIHPDWNCTLAQVGKCACPATRIWQLMVLGLVAPFCEELFFRGVFLKLLLVRLKPLLAVTFSALIFAMAHFVWQPGPLFLGLATGTLMVWRKSLIPGLILHIICNLLGPLLYYCNPEAYRFLRLFFL